MRSKLTRQHARSAPWLRQVAAAREEPERAMSDPARDFITRMPKAELHMHLDGALSPVLMLELARRNDVKLPFSTLEEIEQAYQFTSLQSFLDLLYQGASVLRHERDYYDLTMSYLRHCRRENVVHTEPSFDPQSHTERGVPFDTVIGGTLAALDDAQREWGQSSLLVMDFLRHLSAESAMRTLEQALPYKHRIVAVGLDSSELGNPPSKFTEVFARARAEGFKVVAHAGEEGPPEYVWEAIRLLGVDRIDHGVRAVEDPALVDYLRERQLPLTVCPLSNVRLCVFEQLSDHNVLALLADGLCVTINSDDPEYFGGYVNANYLALRDELQMTREQAIALARNGFKASFLPDAAKAGLDRQLSDYAASHAG
jgi:adenine deaminase